MPSPVWEFAIHFADARTHVEHYATSDMKGHVRMTRFTTLPTQALAIGLFAITGLAAASPMANFVDCSDSFWVVACTSDDEPEPADVPDGLVAIDGDTVCTNTADGFIICHS